MGQTNDFTAGFFTPQVRIYSPSGNTAGFRRRHVRIGSGDYQCPRQRDIFGVWAMATTPTIPEPVRTG